MMISHMKLRPIFLFPTSASAMPSSSNNKDIQASDTVPSIRTPKKKKKNAITSLFKARGEVEEDSKLFNTDVFVVCVGSMGSGKSSFIKEAANVQRDIVGHGLGLKTEEIEGFDLSLPELVHSKIILVDTPGFSDTNEDRILSQLEAWLSARGSGAVYVLYFHPISTNRMTRGTLSWRHFRKLCGGKFHRVVLITTMWDQVVDTAKRAAREEMKAEYWAEMIKLGSPGMKRFLNNRTSALEILTPIIKEVDETTPAVLSTRLHAKLHELKMSLKGKSTRFLPDIERIERLALDYIKKGDELRTLFRQQVIDPDAHQQLMEDYRQRSEVIQSGLKDAKKLTKSGNIFQKFGAIVNWERLREIFSNTNRSQQKERALSVGEDNVLQT